MHRSLVVPLLCLAACGAERPRDDLDGTPGPADAGSTPETDAGDGPDASTVAPTNTRYGGDRPAELMVPATYDHAKPTPLLLSLHGYTGSGELQSAYLGLRQFADLYGVLIIGPDGTRDARGNRFWNAGSVCCDFEGSGVDDVAYLRGLLTSISAEYNVDASRIFILGHSNGGFMAYRMACEAADLVTGIISVAGAAFTQASECQPSAHVNVLQIHGTSDGTVLYKGTTRTTGGLSPYPGAVASVTQWSVHNGCAATKTTDPVKLDLEASIFGAETTAMRFDGCPADGAAELWTIDRASHTPAVSAEFAGDLWRWIDAHPRR